MLDNEAAVTVLMVWAVSAVVAVSVMTAAPFKLTLELNPPSLLHAQYDWTTGVPDNGNEWRKFRAVPRLYPLCSLVCTLFNKGGNRRAFRLPGPGRDHFHCAVEP